jgi:hypothetical protein
MASRRRRSNVDTSRAVHQIHRTLIDVIVVDSVHRKPIGRPRMTLVIDAATRMVAAYNFRIEQSSLPASFSDGRGDIERLPD